MNRFMLNQLGTSVGQIWREKWQLKNVFLSCGTGDRSVCASLWPVC